MSWSSPEHVRVSGSQHLRQASPRSRDSGTQPPSWSPQPASTCPNSGLLHLEKYSRQTLHTSDWGYCTTKPLLLFLFLQPVFEEHLKSYSFSRKKLLGQGKSKANSSGKPSRSPDYEPGTVSNALHQTPPQLYDIGIIITPILQVIIVRPREPT